MRATLDLPDPVFRELKAIGEKEGLTMKSLLRRAIENELSRLRNKPKSRRVRFPVPTSKEPGSLTLTNAEIEELLP